jgi:lambda repressor-like predicted transcriptional regulator
MATHRSRRSKSQDFHAADLIEHLCTERAWSSYDLAEATERVAGERGKPALAVSRRTISRILTEGSIPHARVKAGIALALDVSPWQIWGAGAMPLPHQVEYREFRRVAA